MEIKNGRYYDGNGNSWPTQEDFDRSAHTLSSCYDCEDCHYCHECVNCEACDYCDYCDECFGCVHCYSCVGLSNEQHLSHEDGSI